MKRSTTRQARYQAANKAQENPYGVLVVIILFVFTLFLSAQNVWGGQVYQDPQFKNIDAYARACPPSAQTNLDVLAKYLYKAARTDLEKARAIYVWLCTYISYNDRDYNTNNYSDNSAIAVLASKKAVCAGFSELYTELGLRLGLRIKTVVGYAKGYSYEPGSKFAESDHAWNAIEIDGNWRMFDATWGQGFGRTGSHGELISVKSFNPEWFNVEPSYAIFTHFPELLTESFIKMPLSLHEYERLPRYSPRELYVQNLDPYVLIAEVKRKR